MKQLAEGDRRPPSNDEPFIAAAFCDGDRQWVAYLLDEPSGPMLLVEEWQRAASTWWLNVTYEKPLWIAAADAVERGLDIRAA